MTRSFILIKTFGLANSLVGYNKGNKSFLLFDPDRWHIRRQYSFSKDVEEEKKIIYTRWIIEDLYETVKMNDILILGVATSLELNEVTVNFVAGCLGEIIKKNK